MTDTPGPVPYVIIFEGRNGSSQLVSLLNEHPNAICYPEIMTAMDEGEQHAALTTISVGGDLHQLCGFASTEIYYPQGFQKKIEARPFQAIGFKTKVPDLRNLLGTVSLLERLNFRLIYLRRTNILRAVLSLIYGNQVKETTGDWNTRSSMDSRNRVTVDLAEFRSQLSHRTLVESLHQWFFDAFKGRKISVTYEEMTGEQDGFLARIFDFLELPMLDHVPQGSFVKLLPESLEATVSNFEEIVGEYRNTPFAKFLNS